MENGSGSIRCTSALKGFFGFTCRSVPMCAKLSVHAVGEDRLWEMLEGMKADKNAGNNCFAGLMNI